MTKSKKQQCFYWIFGIISVALVIWYGWKSLCNNQGSDSFKKTTLLSEKSNLVTGPVNKQNFPIRSDLQSGQINSKGNLSDLFSPKNFVNSAPNKSIALGALCIIYGDPVHFEALKQRIKIDPEAAVLLATALSNGLPREALVGYLREAHEQFPNDINILMCLSGTEAKFKNFDESRKLLHDIPLVGDQANYLPALETSMRDLMLQNGVESDLAWLQAAGKARTIDYDIGYFAYDLVGLLAHVRKTSNAEDKLEFASDIIALAQRLNPDDSALRMNTGTSTSLEIGALRMLPPDTAYGDEGKTAKQRLEDIYKIQVLPGS